MKNKSSKVFKASIVYILVSFINKGLGIITIPIFTRVLSLSEMGITTTWMSWLTLLTPVATLSLVTSSFYIAMNEYKTNRNEYQSSILVLTTLSTLFMMLLYFIFKNYLNNIFMLSTPLVILMFLYLIFGTAMDMWLLRQRYDYNVRKMAVVTIASNVAASLIAVLFVLIFKNTSFNLGYVRLFATYGTLIFFGIILYINVLKDGKVYYNKKYWLFGLSISIPLIFHTLSKNILDISDRLMISSFCGQSAVGIYGTIYSISTLSLIIWTAINNAFIPYLYEKLENNKEKDVDEICNISYFVIYLFAVACVALTSLAPEVVKILTTSEYYVAIYIIPPISAGIFLTCIYNLFANVILYHKKSVSVMIATVVAAVSNLILNYIFIPKYGYVAAAYTTLFSYIILSIMQGIMMVRIHKRKLYNIKKIFIISLSVVIICLLFNLLYKLILIRYLIIVIMLVALLCNWHKIIFLLKKIMGKENE